jgi:hypothetical protein
MLNLRSISHITKNRLYKIEMACPSLALFLSELRLPNVEIVFDNAFAPPTDLHVTRNDEQSKKRQRLLLSRRWASDYVPHQPRRSVHRTDPPRMPLRSLDKSEDSALEEENKASKSLPQEQASSNAPGNNKYAPFPRSLNATMA